MRAAQRYSLGSGACPGRRRVGEGAFAQQRREDRILIIPEHRQDDRHAQPGGESEEKSGCDLNHELVLSASLCEAPVCQRRFRWNFCPLFLICSQLICDERSRFIDELSSASRVTDRKNKRKLLAFGGHPR
jgi:hypothetical protein